eukprot:NODE_978_length_1342_cov_47.264501_g810_i0.p1 GENE.NODE_978_length_1342_cov_47.264501_g810_i0~~NODE_978_length_1342_cov_47.264501_g810_i0.p1  ORF type:complete len:424 (+),score=126.65 NODE_978_length_1342_cov_47.264501_g810_i0:33-1274(+)
MWVDSTSSGKSVKPEQLPWKALRTLLGVSIYGSRVDNTFDQRLLETYVARLFTPEAYKSGFKLCDAEGAQLTSPGGATHSDFVSWVERLPETESPEWLGLAPNSRQMLLSRQGRELLQKLVRLQSLEDEDEVPETSEETTAGPQWASRLLVSVTEWLAMLENQPVVTLKYLSSDNSPILRALAREAPTLNAVCGAVQEDLRAMSAVCRGEARLTNHTRGLTSCLSRDVVPDSWRGFPQMSGLPVGGWIGDLARRASQLRELAEVPPPQLTTVPYALGNLLFPDAFITATRQATARHHSWALESLELVIKIGATDKSGDFGFNFSGLVMEGAMYKDGRLRLLPATQLFSFLPTIRFMWQRRPDKPAASSLMPFPLYLNSARTIVLCQVSLDVDTAVPSHVWYERGVCMVAWKGE